MEEINVGIYKKGRSKRRDTFMGRYTCKSKFLDKDAVLEIIDNIPSYCPYCGSEKEKGENDNE